jgi:hypothetical protein
MQLDTLEGTAAYLRQLTAAKPSLRPMEHTGFPLKPGGVLPGLGECYKCGKEGHRHPECSANQDQLILPLEGTFWVICGSILGFSNRNATQINFIDNVEEDEYTWVFRHTNSQ